jgi:hypothetical protein
LLHAAILVVVVSITRCGDVDPETGTVKVIAGFRPYGVEKNLFMERILLYIERETGTERIAAPGSGAIRRFVIGS